MIRLFGLADRRGILRRALASPRIRGGAGGALILAGLTGLFAYPPAGAVPVSPVPTVGPSVTAASPCQPNPSYAMPEPADITAASAGLTIRNDPAVTYGVSGATTDAVRDALTTCAPRFGGASRTGEFLAYTSYSVNWGYGFIGTGAGTCRLDSVKVGLHVNQLLPRLSDADGAPADVRMKWTSFIAALTLHEDGHRALDIDQAKRLLSKLQSLNGPCATLERSAQTVINQSLQDFITANADHDARTNHGADQGAVW